MIKKYGFGFIIGLAGLMFLLPALAQDRAQWAKAKAEFNEKCVSKKPGERSEAATILSDAMYPKVEPEAANLLIQHLSNEIARDRSGGQHDEKVSPIVLNNTVKALKKLTDEKAINFLLKKVKRRSRQWRVRFYIIRALGGINHPEVIKTLVELLDDKEPKILIGTLDSLGDLKAKEGAERACKILNEPLLWEVKIAAINYLSKLNNRSLVEPLIQALGGENIEGRVRTEIVELLKKLTGGDCGHDASAWRSWWEKKKAGGSTDATPGSGVEETTASYYGVKVTSTRIVFILDISGSMKEKTKWVEEAPKKQPKPVFTESNGKPAKKKEISGIRAKKKEVDKREVKTRLDAAKRELINTIYHLSPVVHFVIIFYSSNVKAWKEILVPATLTNKKAAIDAIDEQTAIGGTNIYGALKLAYKIHDVGKGRRKRAQVDKKGGCVNVLGGADTIFLLTDGCPSMGKIQNPQALLDEIKKINETRKIKIYTIGLGSMSDEVDPNKKGSGPPNIDFLKKLAEMTGGVFTDKTSN